MVSYCASSATSMDVSSVASPHFHVSKQLSPIASHAISMDITSVASPQSKPCFHFSNTPFTFFPLLFYSLPSISGTTSFTTLNTWGNFIHCSETFLKGLHRDRHVCVKEALWICACVCIMHMKYRSVWGYVNEVRWSGYQPLEKWKRNKNLKSLLVLFVISTRDQMRQKAWPSVRDVETVASCEVDMIELHIR